MELLVPIVLVFMVTFTIFGVVNMLKQINNLPNEQDDLMGTIGTKPKTQTDYQNEHKKIPPCVGHELESQKEIEIGDINFMHKWIREKSGK
jgi:Na+/H+ antiporter NhaC